MAQLMSDTDHSNAQLNHIFPYSCDTDNYKYTSETHPSLQMRYRNSCIHIWIRSFSTDVIQTIALCSN